MKQMRTKRLLMTLMTALLTAATTLALGSPALAHPNVAKWWQYEKVTWKYTWRHSSKLVHQHYGWHDDHPRYSTSTRGGEHHHDFHGELRHEWRHMHFHRAVSWAKGEATWYYGDGQVGACGVKLHGFYAASRTLPCGSLVSVRHNGRYVFVRIEDRGPFGDHRRIFDLSPKAFRALAKPEAGVIDIKSVRLRK